MEVTCDPARGESLEEKKRRKKAQDHCAPCEITPGFFACCTSAIHAVIVINPLTAFDRNVSAPRFAMGVVVLLAPCCHSLLRSVHISFCISTLYNLHSLVELIAVSAGAEGPWYDYSAYTEVILLSSSLISTKPK
ncbi:hypothetical protein BHM03_00062134 [Ensete ventricosum]|nr:hypothetical protein BHM03_00062134 [Ensete ventricosum]